MSASTARAWYAGRTPASTHRVVDGTSDAFIEAPGLTLQEVADAYLRGYTLPPDDDGSPIRFTVEQLEPLASGTFSGLPDQPATPAPRRGRRQLRRAPAAQRGRAADRDGPGLHFQHPGGGLYRGGNAIANMIQ